jgi:hypothetical protein
MEQMEGTHIIREMLDAISDAIMQIDECFTKNDINTALKKTHEALLVVKSYQDCLPPKE